jgi:hypothetical protein
MVIFRGGVLIGGVPGGSTAPLPDRPLGSVARFGSGRSLADRSRGNGFYGHSADTQPIVDVTY